MKKAVQKMCAAFIAAFVFALCLFAKPNTTQAAGGGGLYLNPVDNTWYYYVDGVVDTSYTGLAQNDFGWGYVSNGTIDWNYTGMIQNIQEFRNNFGDEETKLKRAFVEGKLGGVAVKAGRYDAFFADGNIYDAEADGVELSYGDKVKLTGFVGKGTDAEVETAPDEFGDGTYGKYAGAEISGAFGDVNAKVGYLKFKDMYENDYNIGKGLDNDIFYVGADYTMGNITLSAMYLKGDASHDKNAAFDKGLQKLDDDGYVIGLAYKGAEADAPGSWGLFANYYDQGGQTYIAHTTDANTFDNAGFKGYGVGANYTFAKNMVGTVVYYDTESKLDSREDDKRIWADLTFTF